ncbi:glycine zipper domain-containing protein [uncultured Reyranella sp.]|uniref:glycine zipper domain-containing protein n=1 Tax=uncultured Reyranella sp. TaxID=735512 RepID=UPI00259D109E|nr:glycine zipper domain-containing protein [uncultured Reyranella sp.]
MTALTAATAFPSVRKVALRIVGVLAALGLAAACTNDRGQPTNQTTGTVMGAALGGVVGGLAFGSVGGAVGGALVGGLAGNLVGRALDEQERRRLAEATQNAFVAENNVPTTYTVEPTKTSSSSATQAPPTVVSAKPVAAASSRADGSTCRPIELTATKNGQTTTETTTFCKSAGSQELKPVSV